MKEYGFTKPRLVWEALPHSGRFLFMLNIIKQNGKNWVDARSLFLKIKGIETDASRKFTAFFKKYVIDYSFEEGKDFAPVLAQTNEGRPEANYLLTLECAKHVAMIQRTAEGKAIRDYLLNLDNQVETGVLLGTDEVRQMIELIKCFGVLELRKGVQDENMSRFDEAWQYWKEHQKTFGYSKDTLQKALAKINVSYKSIQQALMRLDKYELIKKAVYDIYCALGKPIDFALTRAELAKDMAKEMKLTFDSYESAMFIETLPTPKQLKQISERIQ